MQRGRTRPSQLQAAKVPVKEIIPKEGVTGWADTWMLDETGAASELRLQVDGLRGDPAGPGASRRCVFGETPVNPKACPYMNKIQKGSCAGYHLNAPASYAKSIRFWKTPVKTCGWGGRN